MLLFKLLFLIIAANSAPVLAQHLLGDRFNTAIDAGLVLADDNPLFGKTKTWRGIIAAFILTGIIAVILNLPLQLGLVFAAFAMMGDLISSFIKRRLGKPASSQALGLDQVPESLLPLIAGSWIIDYSWVTILLSTLLFTLIALLFSPLLYKLGIRKQPY